MIRLDAVKKVLGEQIRCYKELLGVLQKERACLVDLDVRAVEDLAKEKDTLLLRIRLLDEERARLMEGFREDRSAGEDGAADCLTLAGLAELTRDESLPAMRLTLRSLLQSIEDLNGFNGLLIERTLEGIRSQAAFFGALGAVRREASAPGALCSRKT